LGIVVTQEELLSRVAEAKAARRRILFTNGCYDLLHPGHIRLLEQARELGDILILALNSDRSVRGNKGAGRPIVNEDERAEVAAALAAVDYVVVFDEPTPREIISRVLPDVLVKGGDWGANEIIGREEVEAAGGRVVSIRFEPGYSTSSIIERVLKIPS
jgi:D-glycero-beta-D-manno-heptose 1-phosphate adenylyltransferase